MLEFNPNRCKRIRKEFRDAKEAGNEYNLRQIDDNDLLNLRMTIPSPDDSIYLGLKIECLVKVHMDYPFKPPTIKILTPIKHLLISPRTGVFSCDILDGGMWSPAIVITKIATILEENLLHEQLKDHVEHMLCYGTDNELMKVARQSLDEYLALIRYHSQSIINKEVPIRSLW